MRKNSEKEKSRAKTNLTRSKSMSSLKSSTGSIEALRALFESKASLKNNAKTSLRAADFTSSYTTDVSKMNGEVEDVQIAVEEQGMETCADKTDVKDDRVTRKVNLIITLRFPNRPTVSLKGKKFKYLPMKACVKNIRVFIYL